MLLELPERIWICLTVRAIAGVIATGIITTGMMTTGMIATEKENNKDGQADGCP